MSSWRDMEYHSARILITLCQFHERGKSIDSLSKLTKLDFLLRHPPFLDRIVKRRGLRWPRQGWPTWSEMRAFENRSSKYRYGPWDYYYHPILGHLASKGLARIKRGENGRITIIVAGLGLDAGLSLGEIWRLERIRARFLARHFNQSGENLRKLIGKELKAIENE